MSGIAMSDTPGNVVTQSDPVYQGWNFNPESFTVDYYQGQASMPEPVIVETQISDVVGTPAVENLTNPRLVTYVQHPPNIPECVVISGPLATGINSSLPLTTTGVSGDMTYTFQNLNLLPPGIYYFPCRHQLLGTRSNLPYQIGHRYVFITVRVFSSAVPGVSKNSLSFVRIIDSPAIVAESFVITSSQWSVKCPKGFGFQEYENINVIALPDGGFEALGTVPHTVTVLCLPTVQPEVITQNPLHFNLVINGGLLQLPLKVTFVNDNGVFTSSEVLEFISYKGIEEAEPQTVEIYFNGNYGLSAEPVFSLSQALATGSATVVVTPLNSMNMASGVYTGSITIRDAVTNSVLGSVQLRYTVVENVLNPYPEHEYAFTLDNKFLELATVHDDSFIQLILKAKVYPFYGQVYEEITIPYKIALFKKRQQFNIGRIVDRLMKTMPELVQESAAPYLPAQVSFEIIEKRNSDSNYAVSTLFENIVFVAGLKPAMISGSCILDINAGPSRVTSKGIYYLNLLITGYPLLKVIRNGEEIYSSGLTPGIVTRKIYFTEHAARQGDVIEYKILFDDATSLSKLFRVLPEGYNSNMIVWENEYKLKSVMEFTGKYQVKNDLENRTASLFEKLVDIVKKIESTKVSKLTINTGFLLKSDIPSVESLCRAPRAILLLEGRSISLVPTSKSIITVDDDLELIAFDIEFEINRTYNEEIYSF